MSLIGKGSLLNNGSISAHPTSTHATYIIGDTSVDQVTNELHDAAVGISVVKSGGRDGTLDYVDNDGTAKKSDGTALNKPEANQKDLQKCPRAKQSPYKTIKAKKAGTLWQV